jgi:glutaconate CoA-transferase subunit B
MTEKIKAGPFEVLCLTGARCLEDKTVVFVGTGLPMLASLFAQRTWAPNLSLIFEGGSLGPILWMGLPLSVGDIRAGTRSCMVKGLCAVFEGQQRGWSDYAFIGGAEIDTYGNINSTCFGEYEKPKVRFPGSGGAGAMAANSDRIIAIMALEKRRFREKVYYITSIGFGDGQPDYRWKAGVHGRGPYRVVTDVAMFGFDVGNTNKMVLLEYHPTLSVEQVQERCELKLTISPDVKPMVLPTQEQLKLMVTEVDPERYFLGKTVEA